MPLMGMGNLRSINLKGNPLEQAPKFRDTIIMTSQSIEMIDEKKVLLHERQFLYELYKRKK